ncbi:hypothetical protein D770_11510 [Flammeovirgaceae bacterium 311]|nr:hypothetical protein D770_11510 [Flammeovirgaceae bacterium 311]
MEEKTTEEILDLILETLKGKKLLKETRYWDEGSISSKSDPDPSTGIETPSFDVAPWDTNELWRSLKAKGLVLDPFKLRAFIYQLMKDGYVHIFEKDVFFGDEIQLVINPIGASFVANGGYVKQAFDEELKKKKEAEVLEKQLKIATDNANAAERSAKFALYLLIATGVNILLFGFQVVNEYLKEDAPPQIIISDEVREEIEQTHIQIQQIQEQLYQLQSKLPTKTPDTAL